MFEGYDVSKVDFTHYGERMTWGELEKIYPHNPVVYSERVSNPDKDSTYLDDVVAVWGVANNSDDIMGLLTYVIDNKIYKAGFGWTVDAAHMERCVCLHSIY